MWWFRNVHFPKIGVFLHILCWLPLLYNLWMRYGVSWFPGHQIHFSFLFYRIVIHSGSCSRVMVFIFIESNRKIIAHFYCVIYYFDKREIVLKNRLMTIFLKRLYIGNSLHFLMVYTFLRRLPNLSYKWHSDLK